MNKKFEINSLFEVVQKDAKSDVLTIKGYANTVSKDRTGDVIVKEAWMQGGMDDYLKNPIILAFHDYARPVGTTVDYNVTDKGLEIVAEISKAAGEVYNLIKDGVLKTFSVGFSIKDADYEKEDDTFYIKDLELYEISVVSVPANQDSTFSLAKSFENVDEYNSFKDSYSKVAEVKEELKKEEKEPSQDNILKEINMDKKELQDMMSKSATAALDSYKAEVAEKAEKSAAEATLKSIEMGKTQAEKTAEALEAKIKVDGDNYSKAISEMSDELKSAKDEMAAMNASKMQFSEAGALAPSHDELTTAFITAKAMGKNIEDTAYGKQLVEKATRFADTNWETTWNGQVFDLIQDRLVVEPLFNTIKMNARVMNFPTNPEAGAATWVAVGANNDGAAAGTAFADTSSGALARHALSEITMTAHKLATREYIGYEEEEDALIAIAPIVKNALVRRMARSSDEGLLLGNATAAPFTALEESAAATQTVDASNGTGGSTAAQKFHPKDLHDARVKMGVWGHNPSDVVYIVCQEAYYDLVQDDNFLTIDKMGDKATLLNGQVGSVWGSPVVVSDTFDTKADNKTAAVVLNSSDFMLGTYRGLTIEEDRDIVAQQRVIVGSRRFAFTRVEAAAAGKGSVAKVLWDLS